jgi:hypothetical protein
MIIVKLKGGLGNQMFQYAYGRNLELLGKKVVFDTSFFAGNKAKKDTARDFKLNNFNIETKAEFSDKKRPLSEIFDKIKIKLNPGQDVFHQSEKYFENTKDVIHKEFTLKNKPSSESFDYKKKIADSANPISIHIRRGDYIQSKVASKVLGVLPLEYYRKAIDLITKKVIDPHFFVFSDDVEWAMANLQTGFPTIFVLNKSIPDYEELILMSKCSHHIIANSSFSWWGAWLNSNPNKTVIAPAKWFNAKPGAGKDIVPNSWTKI